MTAVTAAAPPTARAHAPGIRRIIAEFAGSAGLAAVVVGSGIAAAQLSPADTGLQLLENALATALGLSVLIVVFAPISGAHFNPVVTLVDIATGGRDWRDAWSYLPAQVVGCLAGTVVANLMFEQPAVAVSTTHRATPGHLLAEVIATAGLIVVIFVLLRTGRAPLVAPAVGAFIGAAYFFTSSTGFANPAITIGRAITDTFTGIAPSSVPWFIAAQLLGAAVGWILVVALTPERRSEPRPWRARAPHPTMDR